jgi:ketosteroid isomerase-like protein
MPVVSTKWPASSAMRWTLDVLLAYLIGKVRPTPVVEGTQSLYASFRQQRTGAQTETNIAEFIMSIEAFESAVTPLLAELEASANAHDTDRHMAAYAQDPSLTFVFNGEIVRGWHELRRLQREWLKDGMVKGTYTYLGVPIFDVLGDDFGLTTFLIAVRREVDDSSVVEKTLAYSALWRRLAEGWRITFANESSSK